MAQAYGILAVWALAACGGGRPPPPAAPPAAPPVTAPATSPCRQAVDHLFAVTSAREEPRIRDLAAKVFVHRCEADRWSEAIQRCLLDVKVPPDADRCEQLLTLEQQQELRGELSHELDAAGVPPQRETGKSR